MSKSAYPYFGQMIEDIKERGTYKEERIITVPQGSHIDTDAVSNVINMCSNNYLGLSNSDILKNAARDSYDKWGFGLSSVRFICGTQGVHKDLERAVAEYFGFEDAILYSSCFDANGGLFQPLLTAEDAIISDELNHASIIDGVRLCKAKRFVYKNNDMEDLERCLIEAKEGGARIIMIATDGVFSMDGIIANLEAVCDLADEYDALVMVDDSHASGFVGETGRGTIELCDVMGRVDILTSTFGKAMGGASGGFTAAKKEVVTVLRQTSRPYLFSNTLAPAIASATLASVNYLSNDYSLVKDLQEKTDYFREGLKKEGLDIIDGTHPIVPVMVYDAAKASQIAERMLELGVYVTAFSYPVVPSGKARIRTQVSAAHSYEDLEVALKAFATVKKEFSL